MLAGCVPTGEPSLASRVLVASQGRRPGSSPKRSGNHRCGTAPGSHRTSLRLRQFDIVLRCAYAPQAHDRPRSGRRRPHRRSPARRATRRRLGRRAQHRQRQGEVVVGGRDDDARRRSRVERCGRPVHQVGRLEGRRGEDRTSAGRRLACVRRRVHLELRRPVERHRPCGRGVGHRVFADGRRRAAWRRRARPAPLRPPRPACCR